MKMKLGDINPMQYKKDIDNLERVRKRSIEAFRDLEQVLCSVELQKYNQFCLSIKVKRLQPMITSEEEEFDSRRLFNLTE